ncbi:uncharacterized protein ASCRUDRAFT_23994, partial [Ascoidea rubescens DSM 1968]
LASLSLSAYIPSDPWSTLTPSSTLKNGIVDYSSTFGIAVVPIQTPSSCHAVSALNKRNVLVSQIDDGQIQATTETPNDSSLSTSTAVTQSHSIPIVLISQISDGQIQATTETSSLSVSSVASLPQISSISEIPQVSSYSQVSESTTTQQYPQSSSHDFSSSETSLLFSTTSTTTICSTTTLAPNTPHPVACLTDSTLALNLKDSVLIDAFGRIGSIVSNRQFQFDGPPPQAGTIFAAGWSITSDGYLALGDSAIFYQCLSGNFYNLYDESIGTQCTEINLKIIDLVNC